MKRIITFAVAVMLLSTSVMAHPGGTDSHGGHIDHSTGEYHYHHGYPAHQHTNGCPYDYVNATKSKTTTTQKKHIPVETSILPVDNSGKDKVEETKQPIENVEATVAQFYRYLLYSFVVIVAATALYVRHTYKVEQERKERERIRELQEEHQRKVEEEKRLAQERIRQLEEQKKKEYEDKRNAIISKYSGKTYESIARELGMPDRFYITPSFLPETKPDKYGNVELVFYISNGKKYHTICGCSGSYRRIHYFGIGDRSPCLKCCPTLTRGKIMATYDWIPKYIAFMEELKQYKINIPRNDEEKAALNVDKFKKYLDAWLEEQKNKAAQTDGSM